SADRRAVDFAHFIDDREAIAAAQIVVEVDISGENVGELHGDGIREPDGIRCGKQGRSNLAGTKLEAQIRLRRTKLHDKSIAIATHIQQLAALSHIAQRNESSIAVGLDANRLPGPQLVERSSARIGAQEKLCRRVLYAKARQHAAERIAALNALLAPVPISGRQRRE